MRAAVAGHGDVVRVLLAAGAEVNTRNSSDYTALSGTATIAEGASSVTVAVTVQNDDILESSETVIATLSSATAANGGAVALAAAPNDEATVTIAVGAAARHAAHDADVIVGAEKELLDHLLGMA